MHDISKLAIDIYRGNVTQYSTKEKANEVLRNALIDLGNGQKVMNEKFFRKNKYEIFEIIEEVLVELVSEGFEGQFNDFVEYRNLALGDTNEFYVPNDDELFEIAMISDGNGNLRRQRIEAGSSFLVSTNTYGVKIYEEFNRFLAGRIDWTEMINRIARSFNFKLANDIAQAVYDSFDKLSATYGINSALDIAKLTELAQHVEAANRGAEVAIFGTKMALAKIDPTYVSDSMKEQRNNVGYYGRLNGFDLREIKQGHKVGTDDWIIDNDFLMVLPNVDNKFIKIVNEGEAFIQENPGGKSADQSLEYLFTMKMGIAILPSRRYGIYRIA
jgi:hypothetical protein